MTQSDNVVMIQVYPRIWLGVVCRLNDWVPIFTDELNIPPPGGKGR
ncbi:hypothetical protein [Salipiger pallidus]|nr:hypothetical protein [Salipiger pallidus]